MQKQLKAQMQSSASIPLLQLESIEENKMIKVRNLQELFKANDVEKPK